VCVSSLPSDLFGRLDQRRFDCIPVSYSTLSPHVDGAGGDICFKPDSCYHLGRRTVSSPRAILRTTADCEGMVQGFSGLCHHADSGPWLGASQISHRASNKMCHFSGCSDVPSAPVVDVVMPAIFHSILARPRGFGLVTYGTEIDHQTISASRAFAWRTLAYCILSLYRSHSPAVILKCLACIFQ